MTLKGIVHTGRREAAGFLGVPWVEDQLRDKTGLSPYPGTLNLKLADEASLEAWGRLRGRHGGVRLVSPDPSFCDATCFPVLVNDQVEAVILLPHVEGYPEDVVEVVAEVGLRTRFGLSDGDPCTLRVRGLEGGMAFDAVLFDFEGTIVDFQWRLAEAEAELRAVLTDLGFDITPFARDNYAVLRTRALVLAPSDEVRAEMDRRFGGIYDRYDSDAASRWTLKGGAAALLARLRASGRSLALVTNVGRLTIAKVLERFGLADAFDAVVTRNDVGRAKPSGDGIRKALSELGLKPERAVLAGDSLSDLFAARDAGVKVAIVAGGESPAEEVARHRPDFTVCSLKDLETLLT